MSCLGTLLPGCFGPYSVEPSGAPPAWLFTSVTYPSENSSRTEYHLTSADFEIVEQVRGEGSSFNLLGLFAFGDSGYAAALEQARRAGADEVMNLRIDTKYTQLLLGLIVDVRTIVTGTAVKWRRSRE